MYTNTVMFVLVRFFFFMVRLKDGFNNCNFCVILKKINTKWGMFCLHLHQQQQQLYILFVIYCFGPFCCWFTAGMWTNETATSISVALKSLHVILHVRVCSIRWVDNTLSAFGFRNTTTNHRVCDDFPSMAKLIIQFCFYSDHSITL